MQQDSAMNHNCSNCTVLPEASFYLTSIDFLTLGSNLGSSAPFLTSPSLLSS